MKTVKLSELEKLALLAGKESLSVEHKGKLIGYYYPVVDQQEVDRAAFELEKALEQVRAETGWNEDELVQEMTKPLEE